MDELNKTKSGLDNWKDELSLNLYMDQSKQEELFLISEYWIEYFEANKNKKNKKKNDKRDLKTINYNNDLLGIFYEESIEREKLPKLLPLNKDYWTSVKTENTNAISSMGYFSNNSLLLNITHKICCFFFLDNKERIRQGYLIIINDDKEDNFELKKQGVFEFIQKNVNECSDGTLEVNNSDYIICVLEDCKQTIDIINDDNDSDNDDKKNINIENKLAQSMFISIDRKGDLGDKLRFIIGKKTYNIDKTMKIDINEKMGNIKDECLKKILSSFIITNDIKNETIFFEMNLDEGKIEVEKSLFGQPRRFTPGLIGLGNIGATCYMNATLQCFSNLKRLRNYLFYNYKNLQYYKNIKKMSFALFEVFKNLWHNQYIQYYEPYNFKEVISEMNPLFKGVAANDPKDLILFLLETIHKELNIAPKKKINNTFIANNHIFNDVFNEFIYNFMNKNRSIICEEFYGCTNSMTTCYLCRCTVHNVQAMNILFFPLEEVRKFMNYPYNSVRIEDCFKYYEKQEIYPSFYCNNCRRIAPGYNQSKLIYTPPTLIVNLNRGRGIQYKVNIVFDQYLNIKQYIYANNGYYFYELIGVICHYGTNDMGGHFIAYCKNNNNNSCEWYEYNDSIVTKRDFNYVKSHGLPYDLFYSFIKS